MTVFVLFFVCFCFFQIVFHVIYFTGMTLLEYKNTSVGTNVWRWLYVTQGRSRMRRPREQSPAPTSARSRARARCTRRWTGMSPPATARSAAAPCSRRCPRPLSIYLYLSIYGFVSGEQAAEYLEVTCIFPTF